MGWGWRCRRPRPAGPRPGLVPIPGANPATFDTRSCWKDQIAARPKALNPAGLGLFLESFYLAFPRLLNELPLDERIRLERAAAQYYNQLM
ncbi:hypothetical protein MTBLM5_70101 [Magnetospirillum sp. LM-5]|nr:hypothetical protein MTBLM5_70101 [Magnetospirillum sp. LM-5]